MRVDLIGDPHGADFGGDRGADPVPPPSGEAITGPSSRVTDSSTSGRDGRLRRSRAELKLVLAL